MSTILVDAWRTVVPPPGDRHGLLAPLLLALTVVTGLVDAFSYLVLGQVFVANMTGNVVFLAFALAGAGRFSILASLVALASFSLGALIGGGVISRTAALHSPESGPGRHILILLLAVAMGLQNATARKLAVPDLTTTVLTLTITGIAADSRLAGGAGSRVGRRLLAALAMFLGALGGGLLVLHRSITLAVTVALIVVGGVLLGAAVLSRRGALE